MTDKDSKSEKKKAKVVLTKEDLKLIPQEEQQKIYARAKKKAEDERREKVEDALYEKFLEAERRKGDPQEELVNVAIDMAPIGGKDGCFFLIDGVRYDHGRIVEVSRSLAKVLEEQMARGWKHFYEVDGKYNDNAYRRERLPTISAKTLAVS